MRKIASPNELTQELRHLLAYAESPSPSREKLAGALNQLAERVAGIRVADKVPSKVMRLVKSRLRYCDWGMRQVGVEFKTEAEANKFEDEANRALGLTGQSDPDNEDRKSVV